METMNIYAKRGDKVVYKFPGNGCSCDQESAARCLTLDREYHVEKTDVGDWHTNVYLQEVPGVAFNSVLFEDATD